MKKGFKIGAASLAALLVFGVAGCGKISDKEGKEWAEKNGYVLADGDLELPAPVDPTKEVPGKNQGDPAKSCDTDDRSIMYNAACAAINSTNLYNYLGLEGVEYIDIRDEYATSVDTSGANPVVKVSHTAGTYSGQHLKGFVNYSYFAYIVGNGSQLFYQDNGVYVPRYTDSVETLKAMFPQDKVLFIMCQSGGRVAGMMALLEQYGWDMSKVYNVGGMGQYTADEYKPYVVNGTTNYEYVVKATTKSGTVGGTAVEVSVKVLYNAKDFKIGKVYVSGGTYSSSSYQSKVDAGLDALLASFEGVRVDQVAGLSANYATGGKDAIAGATESSTLIFEAVKAAVADVVVE